MDAKIAHLLVFSNPFTGRDDEYNDWYDNRHVHDVVAVEGVRWARRYDLVEEPMTNTTSHRYLAIYEFDGDLTRIAAEFAARRADGRMPVTDSFDRSTTVSSVWVPRGPKVISRT